MQVFQMADEFVKPRYKEFINFEETEISNILKEFLIHSTATSRTIATAKT